MKKVYIKPKLLVERFELSQMISRCGVAMVFATVSGCANNLALDADSEFNRLFELGVFNDSSHCQYEPSDDLSLNTDKICYVTSTSNQVFGS